MNKQYYNKVHNAYERNRCYKTMFYYYFSIFKLGYEI